MEVFVSVGAVYPMIPLEKFPKYFYFAVLSVAWIASILILTGHDGFVGTAAITAICTITGIACGIRYGVECAGNYKKR